MTGPPAEIPGEGAENKTTGAVLSTVKVALEPAAFAKLPTASIPVPGAIEIPIVPSPLMFVIVTVRELPVPETEIVPLAVPVLFSVIFAVVSVDDTEVESE